MQTNTSTSITGIYQLNLEPFADTSTKKELAPLIYLTIPAYRFTTYTNAILIRSLRKWLIRSSKYAHWKPTRQSAIKGKMKMSEKYIIDKKYSRNNYNFGK